MRNFNKLFIVVGVLGIVATTILALQPTGFIGRAFGVSANLVIDASRTFITQDDVWKNLAQGGEENGQMLSSVISETKALDPNYIRLDHLFDYYDVVQRKDGGLIFNWDKLDKTVNDITLIGAKPFFVISYTPPALSGGNVTDLPTNWGEWEALVKAFIEHYSGTAGMGIDNVYYEVWNEPDLFGAFKMRGEKNYLDLYFHTHAGMARATNTKPFKFGGPATTGLYENWFKGLLKFASANKLRVDFLSWHRYSKKLTDFEKDSLNARVWLEEFPAYSKVELIVSEAGPNSENDKVYDGNFSAIHTIATSVLLENDITRLFHFEIKDGPGGEKYWGRWGLLTHEKWGKPEVKPRYNALLFLNNIKGAKLNVSGEGSWVKAIAKKDGNKIILLVVNYDPAGSHSEAVPITINNIGMKNFTVKRTDFLGTSAETPITGDGDKYFTIENMKPNQATIFEITPIK